MPIPEISVQELEALQKSGEDFLILDVRNPDEYAVCHLDSVLIPLPELPNRLNELDCNKLTIVHCHAGGRASRAVKFLQEQGFSNVCNLKGGISTWISEGKPVKRQS